MTKFSSFKEQQKLFENWRRYTVADSRLDEGTALNTQLNHWTDTPDSWPMDMDPKFIPGVDSGMYAGLKALDAEIWAQIILQGENSGQVEYYDAEDFQVSPDEVPAEWRREIEDGAALPLGAAEGEEEMEPEIDIEEEQGNDNPSQDVYAMLDALRAELKGTSLEGTVLAIMDKMDANPEMTGVKYHPAGSDDDDIGYDVKEVPHLEEKKRVHELTGKPEGEPASAIERFLGFRLEPGQTLSGELKRAFKDWNAERLRKNDAELETAFSMSPEDSISENLRGEDEMLNLLRTISNKLDGLEDIDTSIDYLASALSGEDALVMKAKQGMFGRLASVDPANLKEELKEFFTKEKAK